MISSGGQGAAVGVAKLTGEIFATIERLPRLVESLSGYDMTKGSNLNFQRDNEFIKTKPRE